MKNIIDRICNWLKYSEDEKYSKGLKFTLSNDSSYYVVSGVEDDTVTEIVIPSSYKNLPIISIGEGAFDGCNSLVSITIPKSVTNIDDFAFSGCDSLISIKVDKDNKVYDSRDNCNAIIETASNTLIKGISSTIIPNSVTSIGDKAFLDCMPLTSITIPNNITSIGDSAFIDCISLRNISIPSSVTNIGEHAFEGCKSLKSVTFEEDSKLTNIGNMVFSLCGLLESISIPNGVTKIGLGAFCKCKSLKKITIPNSVTSISNYAFYGCSSLTNVYYTGSEEQWNSISKTSNNEELTSATITYHYGHNVELIKDVEPETIGMLNHIYDNGSCEKCEATTGLQYTLFDDGYSVSAGTAKYNSNILIPSTYNGLPVTSIGALAFSGCSSLESITIPNSVKSIDKWAFAGCISLTSITIPESVASIGDRVFSGCSSLKSIVVDSNNKYYDSRNNCNAIIKTSANTLIVGCINTIIPESVTSIDSSAFSGCSSLESITIPNSVKSIGESAFWNCKSLTSITIPHSVTSIGEYAFCGCDSLESITIHDGSTSIGHGAFKNCHSLESITIPNSVTSIGEYAFCGCDSLESITLPFVGNTLDGTENTHFGYIFGVISHHFHSKDVPSSLKKVIITGGRSIGSEAFCGCRLLKSIKIPDSVTKIGENPFFGCSSLESIVVDSNNKYYDSRNNCNAIIETSTNTLIVGCNNTTIPESVTSIGKYAFFRCRFLKSIIIPDSVTSIGEGAFHSCSSLESITLPFVGNTLDGTENTNFGYIFGSLDCFADHMFVPSSLKKVIITGGTSIGSEGFSYCNSLESITIPESVTSIDKYAFYECSSLKNIIIGNGVKSIGIKAFAECDSLESIIIPDSVISIGDFAFEGCSSLTSITIPNSVTSVGYAFYGCGFLTNVYYTGTKEQWKTIINGYQDPLTFATIHYNYVPEK